MEAERVGRIFAVFLIAVTGRGVLGGTGSGGNITFFEVSPTLVPLDSSFTIKCTIDGTGLQFPPVVHIKKSFGGRTWTLAENDNKDEEILGELAGRVNVVADIKGPVVSVTLTIALARREDTGNYTCSTANATNKRTTFVSVLIDPVNATMLLNGHAVTGRVNIELERTYAVSCVVIGGNPCPNMTLTSGTLNLTDQISYTTQLQRDSVAELLSPVTCRSSGYISWEANVASIGKPLTCSAVVQGRSTVLTSFEPYINHTEPLFYCNDTVTLPSNDPDLVIICNVYSQVADLTRAYVYWRTPTTSMSIEGNLESSLIVPNSQDRRFTLLIHNPTDHFTEDRWWHMILKVENVRSLPGYLQQNTLEFVAINKYATAKHTVQAFVENVTDPPPFSGADTLKTFSSTLVALLTALGASMLFVVGP